MHAGIGDRVAFAQLAFGIRFHMVLIQVPFVSYSPYLALYFLQAAGEPRGSPVPPNAPPAAVKAT